MGFTCGLRIIPNRHAVIFNLALLGEESQIALRLIHRLEGADKVNHVLRWLGYARGVGKVKRGFYQFYD